MWFFYVGGLLYGTAFWKRCFVGGLLSIAVVTVVLVNYFTNYNRTGTGMGIIGVDLARRRCTFNISGTRPRLLRGMGRFVTGVRRSNAFSRMYSGCFNSNAPANVASTRLSASGRRLIITAGTRFRPFRCGGNSGCCNVSVRVTGLLTSCLNRRLIVDGVRFGTMYLSINRRGYSVTVTNLAIGRSELRRIGFSASCCATGRGLVIGTSSAAFSSYGSTGSIRGVLGNLSGGAAVNFRGKAANRFCIRNSRD